MVYEFSQIAGMLGVIIILTAYFLLQLGILSASQIIYPLVNVIGSFLLLFSLFFSWNTPSVVIEIAWMSISLYGAYRIIRLKS